MAAVRGQVLNMERKVAVSSLARGVLFTLTPTAVLELGTQAHIHTQTHSEMYEEATSLKGPVVPIHAGGHSMSLA